jgi:hypothetical protein
MADAEDSKSSERKLMRVQVPPSAPLFFPTVLRFLARMTLAVKSPAQKSRLTLAELWHFFEFAVEFCSQDTPLRRPRARLALRSPSDQ